jgi:hypothetical protein
MSKLSSMAIMALAAVALAGCGGGGTGSLGFGGGSSSGSTGGTGGTSTYSMGNGSGSSFQTGMIGISSTSLSAGGSTSLQVSIVDQTGALYSAQAVTVTFNSTCISQGLALVTASGSSTAGSNPDTVTTSTGSVDATYTAKGCSGSDVITASATVGSGSLTATGTVTVATAQTGSIQFESATPSTIGLKGTGQTSASTVVFKVLDTSGAPKPGVSVSFTLDTTVGGLSLSPATATSAADGTVQTVVTSGTVHTPVTVTATITSAGVSTRSSVLTVTTGIPASDTFTIAVGSAQYATGGVSNPPACPNVEAWDLEGVVVPVTVSLADRYDNPVLDGTAVSFYSDGSKIVGSCTTANGTGACVADWTSENPQPTPSMPEPSTSSEPGRVVILATAIGEESFTDNAATGFYQSGDPFVNLGEPYDDSTEHRSYVSGDYFLDFNHNGVWDAPPNPPLFVGITCTGTTSSDTCTTNTLALGAPHLLIMSTGGAAITVTGAAGALAYSGGAVSLSGSGGTGTITFNVSSFYPDYGTNGTAANPVAAGSTIAVTTSSSFGTVSSSSSPVNEPCSANPAGDTWTVPITAMPTTGSGLITIQVTSPGTKTISTLNIPVS